MFPIGTGLDFHGDDDRRIAVRRAPTPAPVRGRVRDRIALHVPRRSVVIRERSERARPRGRAAGGEGGSGSLPTPAHATGPHRRERGPAPCFVASICFSRDERARTSRRRGAARQPLPSRRAVPQARAEGPSSRSLDVNGERGRAGARSPSRLRSARPRCPCCLRRRSGRRPSRRRTARALRKSPAGRASRARAPCPRRRT